MYRCASWTVKKAECWKIDAFELWCWRRLLRLPWTARRSNQSILKETSPGYSLEGLMLRLKLNTLATSCEELTHWKRLWCWEGLGAGGERDYRGWDGWMGAHEFLWTLGVGDGQGGLVCCHSWDGKELDTTEWLKWTELKGVKNKLWRVMEGVIQMEGLRNARPLSGSASVFETNKASVNYVYGFIVLGFLFVCFNG